MKERMAAAGWQESVEENGLAEEVYQSNDDDMMMLRKRDESSMPTDTGMIALVPAKVDSAADDDG
jgi:hypothetical protein